MYTQSGNHTLIKSVLEMFHRSMQFLHGVADPKNITDKEKAHFINHPLCDVRYLQEDKVGNAITTVENGMASGDINTTEMHRALEILDPSIIAEVIKDHEMAITSFVIDSAKKNFIVGLNGGALMRRCNIDLVMSKINQVKEARKLSLNPDYIQYVLEQEA